MPDTLADFAGKAQRGLQHVENYDLTLPIQRELLTAARSALSPGLAKKFAERYLSTDLSKRTGDINEGSKTKVFAHLPESWRNAGIWYCMMNGDEVLAHALEVSGEKSSQVWREAFSLLASKSLVPLKSMAKAAIDRMAAALTLPTPQPQG